jgi:hypothetical protein
VQFASLAAYTIENEVVALPNIDNDATFAFGIVCAVTGALTVGSDCISTEGIPASKRLLLKLDAAANLAYLTAAIATLADTDPIQDILFVILWYLGVEAAVAWFDRPGYSRSPFGAISAVITTFGLLKVLFANTFSSTMSARASAAMWGTGSILIIEQVMGAAIRY